MFFSSLFLFLTTLTPLRSIIRESSNVQVQVFDQRKFQRKDQDYRRRRSQPLSGQNRHPEPWNSSSSLAAKSYTDTYVLTRYRRPTFLPWRSASPTTGTFPVDLGGYHDDDDTREPRHARPAAIYLRNAHDVDVARLLCGPQHPYNHVGRRVAIKADAPQYKRDYRRKIVYFQSELAVCPITDAKYDVRAPSWVFEESFATSYISDRRTSANGSWSSPRTRIRSTMVGSPASGSLRDVQSELRPVRVNSALGVNSEHLDYFKFICRVLVSPYFIVGLLMLYFVLDIYKMVLDEMVNPTDLNTGDYELHKDLTWILCVLIVVVVVLADTSFCHKGNDVMGVFDKTFSVTEVHFGKHVVIGLRQGAAAQDVTKANKKDVGLVAAHRIAGRIAEQFHAFMERLGDVLLDLLRVLDEHELELFIGGMKEIDMDE
ncbi:hypothetical protein BJY52DRAFT_1198885 [Lactarius psammicola]|nr:hypothetical protein BJY52DRAFT_1198885 [Lactarius psammicola]